MQSQHTEIVESFTEEFFWLVESACAALQVTGFALSAVKQFSQLS